MIGRTLVIMFVAIIILASGCATPYQAYDWMGIGYEEVEVAPGTYFLSYTGDY